MSLLEEVLDKLDKRDCTVAVERDYSANQFQAGPEVRNGSLLRLQK